jgi:RecB family exonuclease
MAWQKSGASLDRHPMAAGDGPLAKPVQLARLRYGGAFTLWDGNVADAIVNQPRLAPRRPLSATSLEAWATCPFSYFLSRVLGLRAVEKPEDRLSLSPVDRGTLVHAILENFVGEAINQNTAPRPDQAWNDAHRRRLMEIAEARFDEVESRGMTGRDLMWQMDKANIRADLHRFLEEDSRLRYEHGVTPAWLEAGFGVAGGWPAAAITLPNTDRIEFRGYIDRVDVSPDGRRVLVRDYKTGSSSGYTGMDKDPIQAGQRLQLAIYSLAVQSGLSEDVDVNSAYWFISNRGGFSMAPKSPMRLADVKDEFDRTMSLIVSGIDAGVFPANPGNADRGSFANCKYCDFDALCPSKRDLLWQRKSGDSAVRPYAELATAEDE